MEKVTRNRPLRARLMEEASGLTLGARNELYGTPKDNHEHIARIYNAIRSGVGRKYGVVRASDIVLVHMATKLARLTRTPDHRDSYVDLIAYTGILAECTPDFEESASPVTGEAKTEGQENFDEVLETLRGRGMK